MLLASEAHQQAQTVILKHQTDELKKIDECIRLSIKEGLMSYTYDGSISQITKKELERCGYTIECGRQYNESYTVIKW